MVDQDKWFYFVGGKSASSVAELANALDDLSDDEFSFHVNSGKNDFANWVDGVFHHHALAEKLRGVDDRQGTEDVLNNFLEKQQKRERHASHEEVRHEEPHHEAYDEVQEEESGDEPVEEKHEEHHRHMEEVMEVPRIEHEEDLVVKDEHVLGAEEIRSLLSETKHEFELEERQLDKNKPYHVVIDDNHKFLVKEFIYGFIVGLIFGVFMMGALLNIGAA